jgi:hypothetical protein
LQSDVVDISSGEEPACPKEPAPEALEDSLAPVSALVTLQDLQEPVIAALDVGPSLEGPTVTLSSVSLPPEEARLQEPTAASSAVAPPSERVSPQELIIASPAVIAPLPDRAHPQEPIITSSGVVTPPPEQVCFITTLFTSFPCAALLLCLLSGSEPLRVACI